MASCSSFPKGLRVLLVAGEDREALQTQLQSPELQYCVTSVSSAAEALGFLRGGVAAFDVCLAEARMVASDEAVGRSFVDSFEDTPVVLMSDAASTDDVMRAVQLGAVDFLDKPLSLLKLKNIWQHSVRKMMLKAAGPRRAAPCACVPAPLAAPVCVLPNVGSASALAAASPFLAATRPLVACAPPPPAATPALTSSPSLGPESPGTPSAVSGADLPECFSMCSSGADSGAASLRASMDCGPTRSESFMDAMQSALAGGPSAPASLPRPTSVTSLPSAPAKAAAPAAPLPGAGLGAPAQWPALTPGCVWGTPANGPVPPPLPGANAWGSLQTTPPAPVLIKGGSSPAAPPPLAHTQGPASAPAIQPVVATSPADVAPPEGFLLDDLLAPRSGGAPGPIGLKLRKSPSLLNMINSALHSEPSACHTGFGLAPMLC